MSDIANRIIDKMIGGSDHIELAAAQALWGQTVFQGVSAIKNAKTAGREKTSQSLATLVGAGWDKDDPYIKWLMEAEQADDHVLTQLSGRLMDLQQPRSTGLFA